MMSKQAALGCSLIFALVLLGVVIGVAVTRIQITII